MSRGKKAIVAGLCLALAAGSAVVVPSGAFATPQDDLDAAIENRDAIAEQLEASQASLEEAEARLNQIGQDLATSKASLASATDQLEQAEYLVDEKQIEIDETTQELGYQRELLSAAMRSGYKVGAVQFIEFLLGSTSIDDFINRVYYMDKVNKSEAETIAEVEELEAQLETEKTDLEVRQAEKQQQVVYYEAQVDSYNSSLTEAQEYYNSLDADVQAALSAKAAADDAVEEASYMLEVYEALQREEEMRRAAEEAQRLAAEAAAAAQAQAEAEAQAQAEAEAAAQAQAQAEAAAQAQAQAEAAARAQAEAEAAARARAEAEAAAEAQRQQQQQQQQQQTQDSGSSSSSSGSGSSSGVSASVYAAVQTAYAQVGKPYVYGASGPNSFDCSGLVIYCYGNKYGHGTGYMISGIKAAGNWKTSQSQLEYGDLVFPSSGHVGIYIGNNQMIHAANASTGVVISTVYAFYGGGPY